MPIIQKSANRNSTAKHNHKIIKYQSLTRIKKGKLFIYKNNAKTFTNKHNIQKYCKINYGKVKMDNYQVSGIFHKI